MKIMWLCNAPIPQAAKACGISETIHAGWLVSVAEALECRADIEFIFVMFSEEINEEVKIVKEEQSTYILLNPLKKTDENLIKILEKVLLDHRADVVHIWGTEHRDAWAMVQAAKRTNLLENVVISTQGLVSSCAYHYMGGIPGKYQVFPTFRDVIRKDSLKIQETEMRQRGEYEKEALSCVKHVIGRTFWDKACVKLLNPDVNYHFNNETLRETFYDSTWSYDQCMKHSIFVSQAQYPLKGFHFLLEAVALLKEKYPDISVYVSGHDNAMKTGILTTAYGKCLQDLKKEYGLEKCIHYVGKLSAEEMKERYLKAEVFASPSVIENSPNSVGEAMLLGVPVVASNVGGVADLLVHEKEGYLYQADAPYLLAYYIDQLFNDRKKEEEFGKNAQQHARKTHDKQENMRALIEIYTNIAKRRSRSNDV